MFAASFSNIEIMRGGLPRAGFYRACRFARAVTCCFCNDMGKCVFNRIWLSQPQFKWVKEFKGDRHKANCSVCNKVIDVGRMGECALKSHMNSAKHKLLSAESTGSASAMQLTAFFEKETHAKTENVVPPAASNGNETETLSVPVPPMKTNPAHGSVMDFVRKNDVLRTKVLWMLHTVLAHYFYKSNENVKKVFQAMFPDSVIASKFSVLEKSLEKLI